MPLRPGPGGTKAEGSPGRHETAMSGAYWRLFVAYTVDTVGDTFYVLALPLVLLGLGYDPSVITYVFSITMFATVIAGFTLGYLVDRHVPIHVMFWSYVGSAALLGTGAVLITLGISALATVLGVALALGFLVALSAAAVDAGIPAALEHQSQVRRGYAMVESSRTTATLAGPALAGVVAVAHSLPAVLTVNAACFLASAGCLVRDLGRRHRARRRPHAGDAREPALREVMQGLRILLAEKRIRGGIALSQVANLTLGAEQPLFMARMIRDLGVSPLTTSGLVIGAGACSVVAIEVISRRATSWRPVWAMIWANVVTGAAALVIGGTSAWLVAGLAYALTATAGIVYNVYWRSLRQEVVPPHLLGRVSAATRSLAYLGVAVGALGTALVQAGGVPTGTILVCGGVLCLIGTVVAAWVLPTAAVPARDGASPGGRPDEVGSPRPT
ncbi:MAG TPA: MFS transporter [Mycobacteriales bacterium]|nr:MFS transporter [Mycobacteriales bacterium]